MPEKDDLKRGFWSQPSRVYGVDFSGAAKAGKRIWIASGRIRGGGLDIEDCRQGQDLPGSSGELTQCLAALRQFISKQKECVFGMDFPFGLPADLVRAGGWDAFVLSFGDRYEDAEHFNETCRLAANRRELRRITDEECQTPFSPYNLRLYRQTYYGIRDVLGPLVRERSVSVLPMQSPLPGKPWLLEVCPASTLRKLGVLHRPYKGRDEESRRNRARILKGIEGSGAVSIRAAGLRAMVIDDSGGDALDSVVAALASFCALSAISQSRVPKSKPYALEGHVYA